MNKYIEIVAFGIIAGIIGLIVGVIAVEIVACSAYSMTKEIELGTIFIVGVMAAVGFLRLIDNIWSSG